MDGPDLYEQGSANSQKARGDLAGGEGMEGVFSVSSAESMVFARLSGDYNPLHLDPILARRTPFGGTAAHGIHLLIRGLDELARNSLFDGRELESLSATFANPVHTGEAVAVVARMDGSKWRISATAQGRQAFTGTIELRPAIGEVAPLRSDEFPSAAAQEVGFPPTRAEGSVPLTVARGLLKALFPSLAELRNCDWIADLLATTHIIGMRCPGRDSIYSGFRLRRVASAPTAAAMRYRVGAVEERFRLVRLQVEGRCLCGTLEAFFRPQPVLQRSMQQVAPDVPLGAFVRDRVLIIGGSRGLGELTAKITAAGGADVTLTYTSGQQDAERICDDVRAYGHSCEPQHLDASTLVAQPAPAWLSQKAFSHVYFFASPHIATHTGEWSESRFQNYSRMYVTAFAALVERILAARSRGTRAPDFLYPSSAFVAHPQSGFAEYAVAKAAGEALCDQLQTLRSIRIDKPRLPRLRTDQTNSVVDTGAADPFPVLFQVIMRFHAKTRT